MGGKVHIICEIIFFNKNKLYFLIIHVFKKYNLIIISKKDLLY
jgi:hypothetical protein